MVRLLFVALFLVLHSFRTVVSTGVIFTAENADGNFAGNVPSCYKGAYRTGVPGDTRVTSVTVDAEYNWGSTECAGWTVCPPGSYCDQGKQAQLPMGTFGNSSGLSILFAAVGVLLVTIAQQILSRSPLRRGNFCPWGVPNPREFIFWYYLYWVQIKLFVDGVNVHVSDAHKSQLCEPGHYCISAGILIPMPCWHLWE